MFCAVPLAFLGGCNQFIPTFTVEELLANPQTHSHTMVKARGCLVYGMEKLVLQPCKGQNQSQIIWIDDAESNRPGFWGNDRSPAPHVKLMFKYDEARDRRASKELGTILTAIPEQEQMSPEVVLLGQFETIAPRVANSKTELGFGHLGAYAHELILRDVLGSKSNSTR